MTIHRAGALRSIHGLLAGNDGLLGNLRGLGLGSGLARGQAGAGSDLREVKDGRSGDLSLDGTTGDTALERLLSGGFRELGGNGE